MATSKYPAFSSNIVYQGVTKAPASNYQNNTDTIAPKVRLYLEGIEVPFVAISISQVYQQLPVANIEVPASSALLEILRGYNPKVHIFYFDEYTGDDRLLFWGHLSDSSYTKTRTGGGSSSISFSCTHKNAILQKCTMDYGGWANPVAENQANPINHDTAGTPVKPSAFNSQQMITDALQGIDGIAGDGEIIAASNAKVDDAPTNKLDPSLRDVGKRFYGMTGTVMNLWNQYKKSGLGIRKLDNLYVNSVWVPLIEEGLGFFKRMTGHFLLESRVQTDKVPYCHTAGSPEKKVCIPPTMRNSLLTAYQTETAVNFIHSQISFSSEMLTFHNMFRDYLGACGYDVLTLSSPAEIPSDPELNIYDTTQSGVSWQSIETIVTPQLPVYYSPICNVLLPRMYHTINITQNESAVPTRLLAKHDALPSAVTNSGISVTYLGPASIREGVAYNYLLRGDGTSGATKSLQLADTKGYTFSIPGKFELGSGPKPEQIYLPWWLAMLYADKATGGVQSGQEQIPAQGTSDYDDMMLTILDWNNRYAVKYSLEGQDITNDPTKLGLNPFSPFVPNIQPMDRMFFSTIDYEFSKRFMGSRNGIVECLFNPYIIPGYPMDVIDDNPGNPSFHGFCTSVNHSITASGMTTSVGMNGAISYAELSNYYIPPAPPFLQTALDLVNGDIDTAKRDAGGPGDTSAYSNVSSTLIQNPKAKQTADIHYKQVLGVGAVAPDDLIHFASGKAFPLFRQNGVLYSKMTNGLPDSSYTGPINGRVYDDYYSSVGNFRLACRQIESKPSIESKFQLNFIDRTQALYNKDFINTVNPNMTKKRYLEPGSSLFLDYLEISEFIN